MGRAHGYEPLRVEHTRRDVRSAVLVRGRRRADARRRDRRSCAVAAQPLALVAGGRSGYETGLAGGRRGGPRERGRREGDYGLAGGGDVAVLLDLETGVREAATPVEGVVFSAQLAVLFGQFVAKVLLVRHGDVAACAAAREAGPGCDAGDGARAGARRCRDVHVPAAIPRRGAADGTRDAYRASHLETVGGRGVARLCRERSHLRVRWHRAERHAR